MAAALLTTLLTMGFDLELAKESIELGLAADESEAVDWITSRMNGLSPEQIVEARLNAAANTAPLTGQSGNLEATSNASATLRLGAGMPRVAISSPFAGSSQPIRMDNAEVERAIEEATRKAQEMDASPSSLNASGASNAGAGPSASARVEATPQFSSSRPDANQPVVQSRYKETKEDHRLLADRKLAEEYAKNRKKEADDKKRILAQIKEDRERMNKAKVSF
jgi:hypothetical protein